MDRIDVFAKSMENIDYFITTPMDFIYEQLGDPAFDEVIECMRFVVHNNNQVIQNKKEHLKSLREYIESAKPLDEFKPEEAISVAEEYEVSKHSKKVKDISEVIDYVTYCDLDTELFLYLDTLSKEEYIRLKLYFLEQVLIFKKLIKEAVVKTPTFDVKSLQEELKVFEDILHRLKDYGHQEEVTTSLEKVDTPSNIIILPSGKTSFLLRDIEQYPDYSKEIKIAFDKIIDGYFLQTKDLKAINGTKESVYEYRTPSGLRILYVVKNNLILVCSLFYKDKQKSIRIASEYEEAQNRFYAGIEYVLANVNNPDFYIEQAELIAQVYNFLENHMSYSKKVGDNNE